MTTQRQGPFGSLLHRYRAEAGLSQGELAERAGLSRRAISDLERGVRRAPYPVTVRRLAEALKLNDAGRAALLSASQKPGAVISTDTPPKAEVRHNLPPQFTSFIGRLQETADIRQAMANTRLLTLTGPGGVGKTRLALRVAELELSVYRHGVWWLDLAPLRDDAQLLQLLSIVSQIGERPDEALITTLIAGLRPLNVLLVLDNCEHLIGACADLADRLLRGCPQLRLLTTSREVLRCRPRRSGASRRSQYPWRTPVRTWPKAKQSNCSLSARKPFVAGSF
ncbi:MAG: helix-turn-helix domain-containing protein [Chloroflexi bacterium]|nr:helix-turn-helix domain-containing protein [Chloroflexota bacterium]